MKVCSFIRMGLQHKCFLVNISKLLRIAFFYRTPLWSEPFFFLFDENVIQLLGSYQRTFYQHMHMYMHMHKDS